MVAALLMTLVEESTPPPEEYMCNTLKASNPLITQKSLPNPISHSCWLHAEETTKKLSMVVVRPFVVFAMVYSYKYMVLQGMRHTQVSKEDDHNI